MLLKIFFNRIIKYDHKVKNFILIFSNLKTNYFSIVFLLQGGYPNYIIKSAAYYFAKPRIFGWPGQGQEILYLILQRGHVASFAKGWIGKCSKQFKHLHLEDSLMCKSSPIL